MQLWQRLYGNIWLTYAAIMLGFVDVPFRPQLHALLGVGVAALAVANRAALAKLDCPPRLKRVITGSVATGVLAVVTGGALAAGLPPSVLPWLKGLHVTFVVAGLSQAASVATGHDMWLTGELAAKKA